MEIFRSVCHSGHPVLVSQKITAQRGRPGWGFMHVGSRPATLPLHELLSPLLCLGIAPVRDGEAKVEEGPQLWER